MRQTPCVFSVRNNCVVQYYDVSYADIKRNPSIKTLKQNNTDEYKEAMLDMNLIKELPVEYDTITAYTKDYEDLYNKHKKKNEQEKKVYLKPLGTLSRMQVKTMRKALENMVSTVLLSYNKKVNYKEQSYLTFVTLTLPSKQTHTDTVLRKCLTRFIENLQKTYNVKNYIWKAEPQKNGNIHFHLLVDSWVDKTKITSLWNSQMSKLGYLEKYQQKFNTNKQPPTTEIHSLKSVKNTVNYIMKYLTKLEVEKRPIIGKLWGCANITKKLEYPKFHEFDTFFTAVNSMILLKDFKNILKDDYFNVYAGKTFKVAKEKYKNLWYEIVRYYKKQAKNTIETYKQIEKFVKEQKEQIKEKLQLIPYQKPKEKPKIVQLSFYYPQYTSGNFK